MNTVGQSRARKIMGNNFFGIKEAVRYFGINPKWRQAIALLMIPFAEVTLKECRDTHILVADFGLSILDIRGKVKQKGFYDQDWYYNQSFAKERGEVCWRLVRKTIVDNSTNKTCSEQQTLLGKDEETPAVRVMTYAIFGHYLATGERLFEHIYARTSSVDSDGDPVYVGYFVHDNLDVNDKWDGDRSSGIALGSDPKI